MGWGSHSRSRLRPTRSDDWTLRQPSRALVRQSTAATSASRSARRDAASAISESRPRSHGRRRRERRRGLNARLRRADEPREIGFRDIPVAARLDRQQLLAGFLRFDGEHVVRCDNPRLQAPPRVFEMRACRRDRLLDDAELFDRGDEGPVGARDLERTDRPARCARRSRPPRFRCGPPVRGR